MSTAFGTSIVTEKDSFKAGQDVAKKSLLKIGSKKPDVAIIFGSVDYQYSEISKGIKSITGDIPIIGCTSSGEFTEERVTKGGLACALISSDTHLFFSGFGTDLKKDQMQALETASKSMPSKVEGYPYRSALLFLDGLAGVGEETVLAASSVLGSQVKFSGGAAGDDLKFKQTKIFSNNQAVSDAVGLCMMTSKTPIIISVKHGHKPLSKPLRVTKAKGNVLYEVEGRPALEIWKDCLRVKSKEMGIDVETLKDPQMISQLLLKHEAGLLTGNDYKIRFPSSANADGSLNFVCTMTEGSVIQIMDSKEEDQITSARQAAERALKDAKGIKLAGVIVFDCVCRSMILKEQFTSAVEEIKKVFKGIPLIGFETYGEVAMEMGQLSGFHNATTVIMLIPA